MRRPLLALSLSSVVLFLAACSSAGASGDLAGASSATAAATGSGGGSATTGAGGSGGSGSGGGATDSCAPPPPSKCDTESSVIRGVAHFDPAHFAPGAKPVLRLALRHSFALVAGEEKIGGRLHANANVPVDDTSTGEVPFSLDMCTYGAAMWSEENGPFHFVAILDENGNNDIDTATSNEDAVTKGMADAGELVAMADVDLSCHAPSPCLDLTLDCVDGTACTTIVPITSCTKQTPGCESDAAFCK